MKLYKAKTGTPHIVREIERIREFTKGEKMENTAPLMQVVLQRQKIYGVIDPFKESIPQYKDDKSYPKFCMLDITFEEEYELIEEA